MHIGRQAVVIGAGMAGLAAARALADHFEHVQVLERDALPAAPEPRPGTPQSWHLHGLLAGGMQALERLFPGFTEDLRLAGAVPVRINADLREEYPEFGALPQRDFGSLAYTASRALLELTARRCLTPHANVALRDRCRVAQIVAAPDGRRIAGVRCTEVGASVCETVPADLVMDASGRGSLTLGLLQSTGRRLPRESLVGIDLAYASAIVAIPENAPFGWKGLLTHPKAPEDVRRCVMFPIEGNRWMTTLVGRRDIVPPGDWHGFLEYARGLSTPTLYDAIKHARPPGRVTRYAFPDSAWRHFDQLAELPDGLLPIGDAICRFNPVYGQGMTVAAQEAWTLQCLLAERAKERDPLAGLGARFLAEVRPLIETPWTMAALPDFLYPDTRGERPADLEHRLRFAGALRRIALRDPAVHKLTVEVWHLLKPFDVYHDPELARRVADEMAAA
jgi:2-polyprenyl-6-methoxyphenol hydroxylase-like FAD-dependent oxidoreductase